MFDAFLKESKRRIDNKYGFDGVQYFFANFDPKSGLNVGETWSPEPNTILINLIKVCENIILFIIGNEVKKNEVEEDIDRLIKRLVSKKY